MIYRMMAMLVISYFVQGFTLLSGPNEATLPVSSTTNETRISTFYWSGEAPPLKDKEDFRGGAYADLSDEEFMEKLLQEALDLWNNVKGSYLQMQVERDESANSRDADDLRNVIIVEESSNLAAAAFAVPTLSDDYDTIEDCDVTIADTETTPKSLAYTLVHEVGHCLGLGHAHTNYNAIMGYSRSKRNLSLGADDKAGLIYLYPDPAYDSAAKEFLGCAVIGRSRDTVWLWLFLLVPLFFCQTLSLRSRKTNVSV